jgi:hypothetical protein
MIQILFPALFEGNLQSLNFESIIVRKKNENCVLIYAREPIAYLFGVAMQRDLTATFIDQLRITYEHDALSVSNKN